MRRGLSIASIVTIGLVAAATLLLGTLAALGYDFFCARQRDAFQREHAVLTDQLATSLTLPLWNFDAEQIGKVIESASPDDDVYAVVVRAAGPPALSYARVRDGSWKLKTTTSAIDTADLLVEKRNVANAGEVLGEVRVYMTTKFLAARFRQALFSIVGAICLLDLILVVALYLLLWLTVLKPLRAVERYAVAIASGDAAAARLGAARYFGELETLQRAAEKMVGMLEARYMELQKSEGRYRLLAENIGDVIWTMDFNGQVTYVSPSVERLLGFTQEEIRERALEDLLTPESAARLRRLVADLAATVAQGRPMTAGRIELENIDRHGVTKWAENTYEPLHAPTGEIIGILGVCRDITERRLAEAERARGALREQEARREFTRKLIASQEAERRRIASELHDSLGQNLLLIKNRAELASASIDTPGALDLQLDGIADLASHAITEVRQISHDLRPYQLDQLGLTRALRAMIDTAAESTAIDFECRLEPVDEVFSAEAATQVYRVVQEGLNNILKHAQASHARIVVERDVHAVRLLIEDDGRGLEASARAGEVGGFGLQNIAERVSILGGRLSIDSNPAAGTRLEVTIPIVEEP